MALEFLHTLASIAVPETDYLSLEADAVSAESGENAIELTYRHD